MTSQVLSALERVQPGVMELWNIPSAHARLRFRRLSTALLLPHWGLRGHSRDRAGPHVEPLFESRQFLLRGSGDEHDRGLPPCGLAGVREYWLGLRVAVVGQVDDTG
eukprot:1605515-Rhodomonas_salina.1